MTAPFAYFGGKSRVAAAVWDRFGDVPNYVEPFAGSLAVLLRRPHFDAQRQTWRTGGLRRTETVNDLDALLTNWWRAVAADPEAVARYADEPVHESDLHARHLWLVRRKGDLRQRLEGDPDYYDARAAGRWVWGISCWIGGGWCSGDGPWTEVDGLLAKAERGRGVEMQRPHLSNAGMGVHQSSLAGEGVRRQLPHLMNVGRGVTRQMPHLSDRGQGVTRELPELMCGGRGVQQAGASGMGGAGHEGIHGRTEALYEWFRALSARLRRVRVCSGDWARIMGDGVTSGMGLTAVLLDPPYPHAERDDGLYAEEEDVSAAVRAWAIEHGDNPLMRIALCGYESPDFTMPDTWIPYRWKAQGGYGNQGEGRGRENAEREIVWFSPHCLKPDVARQLSMFGEASDGDAATYAT